MNGRNTGEWWTIRDLQENIGDLIEILPQNLSVGTEENHEKLQAE
jgi:hypothetical protein